jgi:hypothetical protein
VPCPSLVHAAVSGLSSIVRSWAQKKKVGKVELKDLKNYIAAYLHLKEGVCSRFGRRETEIEVCIKVKLEKKLFDEVLGLITASEDVEGFV